MLETEYRCENCKYGYLDELEDRYCVNADSENVTEYVGDDNTCPEWTERKND